MVSLKDNILTRNYTWRLFFTSILLTLSSANFAFDNQGFAQTQAMTRECREWEGCYRTRTRAER